MTTKVAFNAEAIVLNTALVDLRLHCWGNARGLDSDQMTAIADNFDAEKSSMKAAKLLLDSPEYDACVAQQIECARYLRNRSIPGTVGVFKRGMYVVSAEAIPEIDAELRSSFVRSLAENVEALIKAVPRLKSADKKRLGELFDEDDYPSADKLRSSISISWSYKPLPIGQAPGKLRSIKASIYEREVKKAKLEVQNFQQTVIQGIRSEYASFVHTLADRLAPSNGEVKRFKKPVMEKLIRFCDLVEKEWQFGDNALVKQTKQMRKLLDGTSFDELRDADVRAGFAAQIAPLLKDAEALVDKSGGRAFRL